MTASSRTMFYRWGRWESAKFTTAAMKIGYLSMIAQLLLIAIVVTAAQIVMKYAATEWTNSGSFFSVSVLARFTLATAIAIAGQLVWFYVLKSTPLSTGYLFLSLVFVLVPLAAYLFFGEKMADVHMISTAFIVAGVIAVGYGAE